VTIALPRKLRDARARDCRPLRITVGLARAATPKKRYAAIAVTVPCDR
jgi:hypothetical protein